MVASSFQGFPIWLDLFPASRKCLASPPFEVSRTVRIETRCRCL